MKRFRETALFTLVFLMSSNIAVYLFLAHRTNVPPFVFYVGSTSFLYLLSLTIAQRSPVSHPYVIALVSLMGLSSVEFVIHDQTMEGFKVFATELYLYLYAGATFFILSSSPNTVRVAKSALLFTSVVSVVVNVYDFLHPGKLLPPDLSIPGRASGLYANPNISGIALVLSLSLTIDLVPPRLREWFCLYISTGVLLTVSRGAILALAITLALFWYLRLVSRRAFLLAFVAPLVIAPFLAIGVLNIVARSNQINPETVIKRLSWFSEVGRGHDVSEASRLRVAEKAIEVLDSNKWLGIGASEISAWPILPHNMYLLFAVEYGLLGIFIYPMFVFSTVIKGWGGSRGALLPFTIAMLLFGLVDHNMMTTYIVLIAAAIVAAESIMPRPQFDEKGVSSI